ncbi:MAG: anaerobic ribonucleoside-triphosphate reductase activating protein [Oscillospiraceae bacterium]|nr:anaerobic ribonucleoside-triphosphate reductase activating protein [Oscillospiraceae bacterium]
MSELIRVSGVIPESIVDGPGIRYSLFVQGCPHHCPGCHNPQTHPFEGGTLRSVEEIVEEVKENPLISGVTFSGGEPMCQAKGLAELAKQLRAIGKNIICYTGYTYEQLLSEQDPDRMELLKQCRYLIDGPFLLEEKSLMIKFRGSRNQRIIDVQTSLKAGQATEANI